MYGDNFLLADFEAYFFWKYLCLSNIRCRCLRSFSPQWEHIIFPGKLNCRTPYSSCWSDRFWSRFRMSDRFPFYGNLRSLRSFCFISFFRFSFSNPPTICGYGNCSTISGLFRFFLSEASLFQPRSLVSFFGISFPGSDLKSR